MEIENLSRWLALGGLLLLYGFFATAETALFALSPLDRLRLKERRPARGEMVESLLLRSQRLLITLILGVEVVTIMASALATSLALSLWGDKGKWIALVVMAPTLLLLGEIIPKSIALTYPARLAPLVAPVVRLAVVILAPVRILLLQVSRGILATLGFRPDLPVPAVHQEDFVRMVEESHRGGMIAALERDFIQNLLDFGELRVGQIMVPRPDIFSLPLDMPLDRMIEAVKRSRFSRIPIYQNHKGKVLGILHAKDLLAYCPGKVCDEKIIRNLLRPPYYVPENKRAFDLLTELQSRRQRLALVVDEYGTLVGLVSVEDLLEELFGEISQEFKEEEKFWEEVAPEVWRVKAALSLMDFNDLLDVNLPMEEFDTVGGLVLSLFGELPRVGDRASYEDLTFKVVRMKGTRILEVEVRRGSP
ncbi:MAG: HlyC/CorC family transporter [Deltaproteobacteria bacterium]|nr:HlyC/CorC family transporter [Deltaproteobacteria bacterium]